MPMDSKIAQATTGRPLTALELALTIVTGGLAVAAVMIALTAPAQASQQTLMQQEPGTVALGSLGPEEGELLDELPLAALDRDAADWASDTGLPNFRDAGLPGVVRAGPPAVSRAEPPGVYPAARLFGLTSSMRPGARVSLPSRAMPLPVEGRWRVSCGYRCGLHDEGHRSTFALDIVREDGKTAGQAVRSPVDGRVVAVVGSSIAICDGKVIQGAAAGAVIIIDFQAPSGTTTHRLTLVHLDLASIPEALRSAEGAVSVRAGTYLGSVAQLGQCSHLHISLNRLYQGERIPEPMIIEGRTLEDCNSSNCWNGAVVPFSAR